MIIKERCHQCDQPFRFIQLTKGKVALVDAEDYDRLAAYKWRAMKSHNVWYAVRRKWVDGKRVNIRMHRDVIKCPPLKEVHHMNFDALDNRKANLLIVTREEHIVIHKYLPARDDKRGTYPIESSLNPP